MPKFTMPTQAEIEARFKADEAAGKKPRGEFTAKSDLIFERMVAGFREVRKIAKQGNTAKAVEELCDFMISAMTAMNKIDE